MERFPSTSEIMPQENEISVESQDKLHEKLGKNKEKLKKILKKMVLWGMISGSALVGTKKEHEAGGVPGFGQGIAPETTTISALLGSKEERKAEIFYADKVVTPESIGLSLSESESAYLSNVFGEKYLNGLKLQWLDQSWYEKFEREGRESKNTAIENFEKIKLPQEILKKIWTETYPKNWVDTEVDSIIFEDESKKIPADYGIEGYAAASAIRKYTGPTTIVFHQDASKMIEGLNRTFSHESGHANDWEADNTLSVEERKQLLLKITKRYLSGENIYYSNYVESINNEDPQRENYRKISEYWAEICEEYFNNPQWFKENHPEDYKIVHQYVKKQDKKFNPADAKLKRTGIILSYEKNKYLEEHKEYLANLIESYKKYPLYIQDELKKSMDERIKKQKEATNIEEVYRLEGDYYEKEKDIINLYEKNKILSSLSPEVKQEINLLEQKYEQSRLKGNLNSEEFLHFLDEESLKDIRSIREKFNLNEKDRKQLSQLRGIIFNEFYKKCQI